MLKHTIGPIRKWILPMTLAFLVAVLPAAPLAAALEDETSAADQVPGQETEAPVQPDGAEPSAEPSLEPDLTPEPGAAPGLDLPATPVPGQEEDSPEGDSTPIPEGTETPEPEDGQDAQEEEEVPPAIFTASSSALRTGDHEAYLSGYAGKLFKPANNVTRAEVSQMIFNLLLEQPEDPEASFSDVKTSDWFYKPVAAMNTLGIVTGYASGEFRPSRYISRAEFVTVLGRCFEPAEEAETNFTDVPRDHWAYTAIAAAQSRGWLGGYADGSFKPEANITRCEAVKVLNVALGRHDDDFAADRETQEFRDVPKTHWAFLEIAEAADPLDEPDPPVATPTPAPPNQLPDGTKVGSTVRVNAATGLNIRKAPVNGEVITAVVNGTLLTVTDISKYPWLGVKTSNGITGYSSADYLVLVTGNNSGGNPPVQSGTLSSSSLTIRQYRSVRLDASVSGSISGMVWSSSNPSVARVAYTVNLSSSKHSAIVYAGSPGTATLTFSDSSGANKATCTVTVTAPQDVRSAYAEGNIVPLGANFDLIAITDPSKDEVRFDITDGPAGGSYTSSEYDEESQESQNGLPTNRVRVFRRTVHFSLPGVYTLRAYAGKDGMYSSESYAFTVQVTQTGDLQTATLDSRRTSGKGIAMVAHFEGLVQEVEEDNAVGGNPTVGYGYVVRTNESFYNNVTEAEAYAALVNTVNSGDYAKSVENFRRENNLKMNQSQFDALVSFVYNCGPNALNVNSYDTPNIILNMIAPPTDASSANPYTGTLNVVKTEMYSQADSSSSILTVVPKGAAVSITDVRVNRSSTKQEVWYRCTYNGLTGWIPSGYVRISGNFTRDLTYADSTSLANEFIQWHKGGGQHLPGLLYRRLAECKVFFFGDYAEADRGHSNFRINKYGFLYPPCCQHLDQR